MSWRSRRSHGFLDVERAGAVGGASRASDRARADDKSGGAMSTSPPAMKPLEVSGRLGRHCGTGSSGVDVALVVTNSSPMSAT